MKFPVYVSLVIVGSDKKETKTGLLKTADTISLVGARLNQEENSFDVALELVKKYIGDVDPNLFFINSGGFMDGPNRYKDAEQDIVLVYKIVVPLHTSLKEKLEWTTAEYCNENRERFLKDHFSIINMALEHGYKTYRQPETIH